MDPLTCSSICYKILDKFNTNALPYFPLSLSFFILVFGKANPINKIALLYTSHVNIRCKITWIFVQLKMSNHFAIYIIFCCLYKAVVIYIDSICYGLNGNSSTIVFSEFFILINFWLIVRILYENNCDYEFSDKEIDIHNFLQRNRVDLNSSKTFQNIPSNNCCLETKLFSEYWP